MNTNASATSHFPTKDDVLTYAQLHREALAAQDAGKTLTPKQARAKGSLKAYLTSLYGSENAERIFRMDLSGANLSHADFQELSLYNINFSSADLHGADFSNGTLMDVNFSKANLSKSTFFRTNVMSSTYHTQALFTEAALTDADLRGAYFNTVAFHGADMQRADLSSATFYVCDLGKANLTGALLHCTDLADIENLPGGKMRSGMQGAILDEATVITHLMPIRKDLDEVASAKGAIILSPDLAPWLGESLAAKGAITSPKALGEALLNGEDQTDARRLQLHNAAKLELGTNEKLRQAAQKRSLAYFPASTIAPLETAVAAYEKKQTDLQRTPRQAGERTL